MTVLKIGETKAQCDEVIKEVVERMKSMGVAYNKKINKNLKISENSVKQSSVA